MLLISSNCERLPELRSDNSGTADDDVYSINASSLVRVRPRRRQTIAGATFNTLFNGTYGNLNVTGTGSKTLPSGNVSVQGDLVVAELHAGHGFEHDPRHRRQHHQPHRRGRDAHGRPRRRAAHRRHDERVPDQLPPPSTLDPTSTVEYYGTGAQSVVVRTYGHLTVSGGNTKTAAGVLIVAGNFLINTGTTFAAGAFTHEFRGQLHQHRREPSLRPPVPRCSTEQVHRPSAVPRTPPPSATSPIAKTAGVVGQPGAERVAHRQPHRLRRNVRHGRFHRQPHRGRRNTARCRPAAACGWAEQSLRSRRTTAP